MSSDALFLLTLFVATFIMVLSIFGSLTYRNKQKHRNKQKQDEIEASIVPGSYISTYMVNCPYNVNIYDYVTVLEVKDGWVRYVFTLKPTIHSTEYTCPTANFVRIYTPYPFSKK